MLSNCALEHTIRRFQVNQDGLKLNGTPQRLGYAEDDNILEGNVHTVKENGEALIVTSKAIGLDAIADKSKFMVGPRN